MRRVPSFFRNGLWRCAALTIAALAVAIAVRQWERRVLDAQAAEIERREALKARLRKETDDPAQAERGAALHANLAARGVIGPERRLDWIDRLARTKETHQLAAVEYELAPQRPAGIGAVAPAAGRYEFMASPMTLKLNVLHEQQLLDFFDDLGRSVPSLLRIRSCRIERLVEPSVDVRLAAECVVDWITVREKA